MCSGILDRRVNIHYRVNIHDAGYIHYRMMQVFVMMNTEDGKYSDSVLVHFELGIHSGSD